MSEITFLPNSSSDYSPHFGVVEHSFGGAMRKAGELTSFSTSQMALLAEQEVKGYDIIRIVNKSTDVCVIRNDHDGTWSCDRTQRDLRDAHNFYRLWRGGEFDRG